MRRKALSVSEHGTKTLPFEAIRMLEIELSQPLPTISAVEPQSGRVYRHAHILIRLHNRPLDVIELRLMDDGLPADIYAPIIWQSLHRAINAHLCGDGLPEVSGLSNAGLPTANLPPCLVARQEFLAAAPFVSVIVCTRDHTDELARCLTSLLALEYPRYEILVVDNAPRTSATADLIRERFGNKSRVRYVREDRPGLSWARNCGLQHARGEFVAFTDDDVIADSHWVAELTMAFGATADVACVTGMVLPAELETQSQLWFEQFGGFYKGRGFSRLFFNLTNHRTPDPLYPYITSKYGAGANMAFRTSVICTLGGFDPALGIGTLTYGSEDIESYFRILSQGYTLVFEPAALLYHFHRGDIHGLRKQMYGYGVGFTAYLTRCIVDNPRRMLDLLRRLPYAIYYLFSPRSSRNERKQSDYPPELTRRELVGMLYGPIAYLQSRWLTRQIEKRFGPVQMQGLCPQGPSHSNTR